MSAHAQECQTLTTCTECLEASDTCGHWYNEGGCLDSCMIADSACYTNTTNIEETCLQAAIDEANSMLCSQQSNCSACVSTTLADGNTTCQWFTEGEYCSSICGLVGCGDVTCETSGVEEEEQCDNDLDCVACLESSDCGHWQNEGGCFDFCMIQDVACYTTFTFPNFTNEETCQAAANNKADQMLCSQQANCTTCVATTLISDDNTTCQWFTEGEYCGSACGMTGCGEKECRVSDDDVVSNTSSTTSGGGGSNGIGSIFAIVRMASAIVLLRGVLNE